MARTDLAGGILALALVAGFAGAADDPDPEPAPRVGPSATSGDLTVRVYKTGLITATGKHGKRLWATDNVKGVDVNARGQVVIVGGHAVIAQAGSVFSLETDTGRVVWSAARDSGSSVLSVKGQKVTLKRGAQRQVIDLKTGKVLESAR
jgi:outer membrane protein assembly factor BamB